MNVSIVIPVYNGGKSLKELYEEIRNVLTGSLTYEMIFIYDCGNDNSWKVIKELAGNEPNYVRGFHLDKNYGQHIATLFGFKNATGEYIITLDEDSQHDPKYIPEMIKRLEDGNYDFVYGKFRKIEQPFFKVFLSSFLRRILSIMVPNLPHDYSSYRVIRKDMVAKVVEEGSNFSFIDAALGNLSSNYSSVIIDHCKRLRGRTSYTINTLFKLFLDVLFGCSKRFRIIYNTLLCILLLCIVLAGYLTIIQSIQLQIIAIILLFFLIIMLLLRMRSFQRIKRNLNPSVIEQLNRTK
jgi:undecaprenyl-phosphate 4-deoxy-4-formamido-L-arabinose transferase